MSRTKTGHGQDECGKYKCRGGCGRSFKPIQHEWSTPINLTKETSREEFQDLLNEVYYEYTRKEQLIIGRGPFKRNDPMSRSQQLELRSQYDLKKESLIFDYFLATGNTYEEHQIED